MLDQTDRAILNLLQLDNQTPQRIIAEKINLSAPAVQRRIHRLETTGVISSNVAVVDPVAVGRPLTIVVEIELVSEHADQIDVMKKRFSLAEEVQQCYYVTGEFDFILVVTVANMSEYESLTRRLFFSDSNVKRFRTSVAMDRVKVGLYCPA